MGVVSPVSARGGRTLALLLENVKFEHSLFALPFAYLGMLLAARGLPTWWQLVWITVAMVAARTLAMSLNRVVDRAIDARNPRTASRPVPSGRLSTARVLAFAGVSLALLVVAAALLNEMTLRLLPIALVFLVTYHYVKRFSPLCHLVLGITDAAAPMGAWVAVTGSLDPPAILLGVAVAAWVGGFDLLYACQDVAIDRREGLHSVPADFGVPAAFWLARLAHVVTLLALAGAGVMLGLGGWYWLGLALAAALLIYEHRLVSPADLSRLNMAFFNVNGYLAVGVLAFTALDVFL